MNTQEVTTTLVATATTALIEGKLKELRGLTHKLTVLTPLLSGDPKLTTKFTEEEQTEFLAMLNTLKTALNKLSDLTGSVKINYPI